MKEGDALRTQTKAPCLMYRRQERKKARNDMKHDPSLGVDFGTTIPYRTSAD